MSDELPDEPKTSTPDEGVLVVSDEVCTPPEPRRWRPAEEPTCCGSGCIDCPF